MKITDTSMSSSQKDNAVGERLTKDETAELFRRMANTATLRLRNVRAYELFGMGAWVLQARSATQLKTLDPGRAVYVPMASLPMFLSDATLYGERVDPRSQMILVCTYMVSGENTLSYVWTKASFPVSPTVSPTNETASKTQTIPSRIPKQVRSKNPVGKRLHKK